MTLHYTLRLIEGREVQCLDVGCDDFDRAALNRDMVKNQRYIQGYLEVETAVTKTPLGRALPTWITEGFVPSVLKGVWSSFSGGHIENEEQEIKNVVGG
jgi:hypothetical protein